MKSLFTFLFSLLVVSSSFADTIKLRADEWCPYNCTPKSAKPGYIVEVATKILEEAGHKIDYQIMAWTRALEGLKTGDVDGAIGASKDDAPGMVFSDAPQGKMINAFFVKKGSSFKYSGVSSLNSVKLGAITGYSYFPELDEYIKAKKDKVDLVAGDDALDKNIKKLEAGRIDVLVEDQNVFSNKVSELGMSAKFDEAGRVPVSETSELYIAFSNKNPKAKEYAKLLGDGIKKMRASGELAKILAKYNMKDWQ